MTTSMDIVPLKAFFPTSPPTVLDVASENLLMVATLLVLLGLFPLWRHG